MYALLAFIQGIPGVELIVVLFVLIFQLVVPVLVVSGIAYLLYRRLTDDSQNRVVELEARVNELERKIDDEN